MPFDGTAISTTTAHLIRVKQYILDHGWCSDGPEAGDRVCMARAIGKTAENTTTHRLYSEAIDRAAVFMLKAVGAGDRDVWSHGDVVGRWNDAKGRTLEEVFAAFDRAIALAMYS